MNAGHYKNALMSFFVSATLFSLTACGGGGGGGSDQNGGGGSAGGGGSSGNPGTPGDPNSFRTPEFNSSSGLDQIRAAEGFAQITGTQGGAGVRIAVIDNGFDLTHPDLLPNLEIPSDAGDIESDTNNTAVGTAVAGIIAGAANGSGIQGVAFNSTLLPFGFSPEGRLVGIFNPTFTFTSVDTLNDSVGPLIESAAANGASIINATLSLSRPQELPQGVPAETAENLDGLRSSMLVAVQSGSLIVSGTGDDTNQDSRFQPNFPAAFAGDPELANGVIAVASVNEDNLITGNICGDAAERCLAAPGANFQGAQPGGGVGDIGTRSSFAAALVSGSAAVVLAAFPGTTPQEAGDRLLNTATDLGPEGTDDFFGRGLLNLENALSPQGSLSLATSSSIDGPKVAVSDSSLNLGNAFALGGSGAALLSKAVTLDDDNFPFGFDLGNNAQVQSRTTGLAAFINSSDWTSSFVRADKGDVSLSLAQDQELSDPYRAEFAESDITLKAEAAQPRLLTRSEVTDDVDMFFAFNNATDTEQGLVSALPASSDFFQPAAFLAPFDQLAGEQTGGGTTIDLGTDTKLSLSAFTGADDQSIRQTAMQKIELTKTAFGNAEFRLGYGFMQEDGGFIGSDIQGAFGAESGGNSQYVSASLLLRMTERLSLFGAYSRGSTDASGGTDSLISDYSSISTEAFGGGLVMKDLVEESDRFTFMVGQPLRVSEGSAEVTVPVGRTEDGDVRQDRAELDLSPDGREIAIEAVYKVALDDSAQSLTAGSFVRFNPDHDPNADPDVGFGVTYGIKF